MLSLNLNTLFHAFTLQSGSHLAKTTIIDMLERYNFIYLFHKYFWAYMLWHLEECSVEQHPTTTTNYKKKYFLCLIIALIPFAWQRLCGA